MSVTEPSPLIARCRLIAWCLIAAHLVLLAILAWVCPGTADEPTYLGAGRALRRAFEFDSYVTILHGPLPFLANQTLWFLEPADPEAWFNGYLWYGRLGMLSFAWLAAWSVWRLARSAFGERAGLATLALHAVHPVVLGHAPLMTADMALAAGYTFVAWRAFEWLRRPGLGNLLALGIGLGATLATKYLALFLLPALALTAGAAIVWLRVRPQAKWRAADSTPPTSIARSGLLVGASVVVVAAAALATLHSAYLWQPGGYDPKPVATAGQVDPRDPDAGPLSQLLRDQVDRPAVRAILALLPEPFVRGIDYQKLYSESGGETRFGDSIGPGFWGYFPTAVALKLPLAMLLLVAIGAVPTRRQRQTSSDDRSHPIHFWLVAMPAMAVPTIYLSGFTSLQLGIRYLLPVLPLLTIVAGLGVARLLGPQGGWQRSVGRGVVLAAAASIAGFLVTRWPHYAFSFNALAAERPYLWFSDSNLYWPSGLQPDTADEILANRAPDSHRVFAASGPRMGRVRAHASVLGRPDPRDPTRVHHWLAAFEPIDSEGPHYLFEVTDDGFAKQAKSPRAKAEWAAARLGVGDLTGARDLIVDNQDPLASAVRAALERTTPDSPAQAAVHWQALGRFDRVLELGAAAPVGLRAAAALAHGDPAAAMEWLDQARAQRTLALPEVLQLGEAYRACGLGHRATPILEASTPPEGHPARSLYLQLVERHRSECSAVRQAITRMGTSQDGD